MASGEILAATSAAELVEITGVDPTTARRWKTGRARMPTAAARLASLRILGDLASLAGPDWQGWTIGRDGLLHSPRWRRGFSRVELEELPTLHGQRAAFDVERRQLQREVEQLRQDLQDEKKRAAFYRAQLVSESRIGLALFPPR